MAEVMLQLTQRPWDLQGLVNITVKDWPALPGSLTSVYERYSRERKIFICVLGTQVFVSFQLEFMSPN